VVGKPVSAPERPASRRFASDAVPLPGYLPPGTIKVTEWDEVMEVLRSPHIRHEPPMVPAVHEGGLGSIDGAEHRDRRRVLKGLVRPAPLRRYREEVVAYRVVLDRRGGRQDSRQDG
jgi:cytochrome P450